MSSLVVTRPVSGGAGSGIPGTSVSDIIINPGDTIQADSSINMSSKWIYTLISETDGKVLSGEVLGINRMGTNPTHTTYAVIGDRIPHQVGVVMSGVDMVLEITNNTSLPIKANIIRIDIA